MTYSVDDYGTSNSALFTLLDRIATALEILVVEVIGDDEPVETGEEETHG
jgi:hypothetical protein